MTDMQAHRTGAQGRRGLSALGNSLLRGFSPLVLLVGLIIGLLPLAVHNFYYLGLVELTAIYTIVSFGNSILIGYAGQFTLGQGAVYAVGAYASTILTVTLKWPVWAGMLGAVACAAAIGLILGLPALRLRTHYLAMITLGFALVTPQLILNLEKLTGGWQGISGVPRPSLFGAQLTRLQYYYVVAAAALLVIWVTYNLLRSRWRLAFLAIHDSELAASSLGISVYHVKVVAFVFASAVTGFGGALYAHYLGFISPDNFSLDISIFFVLTVVLGGSGTLSGPLWGTLLLVFLPELLSDVRVYALVIYGLLLMASQVFIPQGLVGAVNQLRERLWPAWRPGDDDAAAAAPEGFQLYRRSAPQSTGGPVLELQGVSKLFGGVTALHEVNLAVQAGTIHGLIGPNGSGKTTTLNVISGFYQPSAGQVIFRGAVRHGSKPDRIAVEGIGRTLQTPRVFPQLSVLENVMVGLFTKEKATILEDMLQLPRGVHERRASRQRAEELLRFVGLHERRHELAKNLPHGQQRFLEIARALTLEPTVLLLDEPAAGLSGQEIDHLADLIRRIRAAGCSILLVEHHVDMVMNLADQITVLDYGVRIASGPPDEVRRLPEVIKAYLGAAS